jgi:hypothetical protein
MKYSLLHRVKWTNIWHIHFYNTEWNELIYEIFTFTEWNELIQELSMQNWLCTIGKLERR